MDFSPILLSMKTASVAIVFTFFLGLLAARWVAGIRRPAVKLAVDVLFTLPLVLPPTVVGFFLLFTFGVRRPVGQFLLEFFSVRIVFTWWATVLAAVVIAFPLMYRATRGAFEQVDPDLIAAAKTLGLGEFRILWQVLLPVALPGVASGAILAFARGLGEFGATAMIAGNIAGQTRTLPLAVYSSVAAGDMGTATVYVAILVAIAVVVVCGMNWFALWKRG